MLVIEVMDINVCRICCENDGTIDIFDENHGLSIKSKIMYCCANVFISYEDGLPSRVCRSCEEELSFTYEFVLKCETAHVKLRSCSFISAKSHSEEEGGGFKQEFKYQEKNKVEFEDSFNNELDAHAPLETNQDDVKSVASSNDRNAKNIPKRKVSGKQCCKDCGKQCNNPSSLAIHMRKHSEHRPYACSSCDKKYKDGGGLKRHIERNHNHLNRKRQFVCENCGKAFFSKPDVTIHMRTHTGETPFACDSCPLKFTQIGALLRHNVQHTSTRTHPCLKCNKMFQTKENLRRHQVAHSSEKKYICTMCNVPFKYKNNLRKHIKLHSTTNNFICNHCGRTFNAKGNLKKHLDNMHSDKSGFCGACSKNVPDVQVHMLRHTGKRPLKCELCPSTFFDKKSLTRHQNFRHKESNKYECSVEGCPVSVPSRPMLQYHVARCHGSSVPFPCDQCSKGFYRKTDLAKHRARSHT